ncbi:MAG: GNAT family N-acetyltransferase [Anaerolineales bacterium]
MTAGLLAQGSPSFSGLRPVDSRRDLAQVADLIEEVFRGDLDALGRRMVREMRVLGKAGWLGWGLSRLFLPPGARPQGFVWEEDGRVVGNASLLAVNEFPERWVLANVAVSPDYRRRGIARQMVEAGIDLARERGATALYLQVERDNPPAQRLYQQLGFESLITRTNWRRAPGLRWEPASPRIEIRPRRRGEWDRQWELAAAIYPEGLFWPYPLAPGFFRADGARGRRHWLAWEGDRLLGSLTIREGSSIRMVILAPPEAQGSVERDLVSFGLGITRGRKPIAIDYLAEVATQPLLDLGFRAERTLTWMRRRLRE